MAIIKPSERYTTHKIGSSSDPTKPVGADDLVIVESVNDSAYPNADDRVRVAKQKDIIEDYFGTITGKNLYNPAEKVASAHLDSSGGLVSIATYVITGFIPVSKLNGTHIYINKISTSSKTYNIQYDNNKEVIAGTVISGEDLNSASKVMALHDNAAFVRYTLRTDNQTDVQVEYGQAETSYVAWAAPALNPEKLLNALVVSEDNIADGAVSEDKIADGAVTADKLTDGAVESKLTDVFGVVVEGTNLFSQDDPDYMEGYSVLESGETSENVNFCATGFIPVVATENYTMYPSPNNAAYSAWYTVNKVFISSVRNTAWTENMDGETLLGKYITAPANAAFLRISIPASENKALVTILAGTVTPQAGLPYYTTYKVDRFDIYRVATVRDFGATGNGITDDTDAFTAALASSAKSLYIPDGTYLLSGITITSAKPISLVGQSQKGTILKLIDNPTAPLITLEAGVGDFTLENMTLAHRKNFTPVAESGLDGVLLRGSSWSLSNIKNVTFRDFSNYAINFTATGQTPGTISNCAFFNGNEFAIYFDGEESYVAVHDCTFKTCKGVMKNYGGANVAFRNNMVTGCGSNAAPYPAIIYCSYVPDDTTINYGKISIVANTINHCFGGIELHGIGNPAATTFIVAHNQILVTNNPIKCFGLNSAIIMGNVIRNGTNGTASLTLAAEGTTECVKCVVVGNVRYGDPAFDFGGGIGNQIAYNSE